jgi:hypothetical protein
MGEGHDDCHGRWRRWCGNRRDSGMARCSFKRRGARDARDALAASLKPQVQLDFDQDFTPGGTHGAVVARVTVVGPLSPAGLAGVFPAADARIELNLTSGRHGANAVGILEPTASRFGREPPYLKVVIGEPSDEWPPPDGDHGTATVTYSDIRGAGTYRLSRSVDLRRHTDPGVVSFQNLTEPVETRIRPLGGR